MIEKNLKRVCFLELVEEAEDYLTDCEATGVAPGAFDIVALSPEVQVFLSHREIPYRSTLDFFDNEGHGQVMTHIDLFQTRFEELFILDTGDGVVRSSYTDSAIYISQYYINYFLFILTIIDLATSQAEFVLSSALPRFPGAEKALDVSESPHLRADEPFASAIVCAYCRTKELDHRTFPVTGRKLHHAIPSEPLPPFSSSLVKRGYGELERRFNKRSLVLYLGGGGANGGAITRLLGREKHLRTLAFNDHIRMRDLLVGWARMFRLIRGSIPLAPESQGSTDSSQIRSVLNRFAPECLRGQLIYKGVDFWEIFEKKIRNQLMPYLVNLAGRIDRRLQTLGRVPANFVVATGAREENFAVGEWAFSRKIPFVMVAHGTAIRPANRFEDVENRNLGRSLLLSSVVTVGVLQSKLDAAHVKHYAPRCQVVETGPILYVDRDRAGRKVPAKRKRKSEPKTIMIGSSYKSRGQLRFWAVETPDEYLQSCRDMVSAVNEMDDSTRVLIRFHPKLTMSPEDFRSLLPDSDKLDIERGGRFLDSMKKCDLVVNFSSSSIEESIQSGIPVLLYDRWGRYQHCQALRVDDPADIEPSAVYYQSRHPDLKETLKTIVECHLRSEVDSKALFEPYQYPDAYIENFLGLFSKTPAMVAHRVQSSKGSDESAQA